jgi:predicted Fe-Mo cluster-binding NifX family protein
MTKIKLAIPTDDGEAISRHFGQAKYFRVITLENNRVASSELREKASHQHGDHSHPAGVHPGQQMVEAIADCQTLLSGGMGTPAYNRAIATGLEVILTQQISIDSALQAYMAGTLKNEPLLIHTH